jgi:primosomal protein N' (replication factor Y)
VTALFPEARTAIVTSDTIWSPARAAEFVRGMEAQRDRHRGRHPAGHQGLSFPNLTLVGVIDADLGLSGGDLRAAERTFQQIAQVAGARAGETSPGGLRPDPPPDAPSSRR